MDALARLVDLNAATWHDEYELALLSLTTGQPTGYRESCRRLLESGAETTDSVQANFTAWTCGLAPAAIDDYDGAIALASKAHQAVPDNHHYTTSLGATLYRAGQYEQALETLSALAETLEESDRDADQSPAYTWYFLAMTHDALGNTEQSRHGFTKADDWTNRVLEDEEEPPVWSRRLTLELLRKESRVLSEPAK